MNGPRNSIMVENMEDRDETNVNGTRDKHSCWKKDRGNDK